MKQVEKQVYCCKLCGFTSRSQGVETHIFARHLVKLYLYRCHECGKMFRYQKSAYKNHVDQHVTGKLSCNACRDLRLNLDKQFTKESLAAHMKRFHANGDFQCKVGGCDEIFGSAAHLKHHEINHHPQLKQKATFACQICQASFARKTQLQTHMQSCEAGRSRTLFRQHIADCLTWEGKGVYSCNLCSEKFHPPRPTTSSLPLARKHLISVHNKVNFRKTKMSWTQGVEGLNMEKKAERQRKRPSSNKKTPVASKVKRNDKKEVGDMEMAVVVEQGEPYFVVPEQIPSSQEVVI